MGLLLPLVLLASAFPHVVLASHQLAEPTEIRIKIPEFFLEQGFRDVATAHAAVGGLFGVFLLILVF